MPAEFQSTTFALVVSWITCLPALLAVAALPMQVLQWVHVCSSRAFTVWVGLCLLTLSQLYYLFFLATACSSYPFQSTSAFLTAVPVLFYFPLLIIVISLIAIAAPVYASLLILGQPAVRTKLRTKVAWVATPALILGGTLLFNLLLPIAGKTVYWLNPNDVIRATNGPASVIFKYFVARDYSYAVVNIYHLTPRTTQDRMLCHVAAIYLSRPNRSYFADLEYPEIQAARREETKTPRR